MKKCLPLALILISIHSLAQIKGYSVSISGNYPIINHSTHKSVPVNTISFPTNTGYSSVIFSGTVKESYEEKAGLDLQTNLDIAVSRRFFVTTGLSAMYIRYKHAITVEDVEPGPITPQPINSNTIPGLPFGSIYGYNYSRYFGGVIVHPEPEPGDLFRLRHGERTGETNTLYLEVPLLAGASFLKDKLDVRTGFVGAWLMQAVVYKSRVSYPDPTIIEYKDKSPEGFSKFLAGVTVQSTYRITRSIGIDLTARKYLTRIYENDETQKSNARYTILSLGARYTFKP